jgi:hypothetical protein
MRPEVRAMGADLACAFDRVALARQAGFEPDPWQADMLRSDDRNVIINVSRQAGKSTGSAVVAAHEAIYRPKSLTLMVAPALRQAQELFKKTRAIVAELGHQVEQPTEESALRLEFSNGSRIVALPGSERTIRGYSGVTLLIEDEASRVPDELHMATRPMLAVSGGRQILLSTPFGRRGHFHDIWENGGDRWKRIRVTAYECPRIDPAWLEGERASMPAWWFEQEFCCEFKDTDDQLFGYELVASAITPDVRPLFASMGASA